MGRPYEIKVSDCFYVFGFSSELHDFLTARHHVDRAALSGGALTASVFLEIPSLSKRLSSIKPSA